MTKGEIYGPKYLETPAKGSLIAGLVQWAAIEETLNHDLY